MKIIKLEMKNFMPFHGDHFIDFPQEEYRNVMLIRGENEKGKTSIMNAIRWGFYGNAISRDSQKIEIPQLVNRVSAGNNDWTLMVSITFSESEDTYTLIREAKKNSLVHIPKSSEDFKTEVILRKNGAVVLGSMVSSEINRLAPEQVSQFYLFDGESLTQYEKLLFEKNDQVRQIKTAIEQVLGVPALVNGRGDLKVILADAESKQAQALGQIETAAHLAANQQTWSSEKTVAESDLEIIYAEHSDTRKKIAALEQVVNNSEASFAAKSELDAARAEVTRYKEIIAMNQSERLAVISDAWIDILEIKLRGKIDHLRHDQNKLSLNIAAHTKVKQHFDSLNASLNSGECSVCHQPIFGQYFQQLKVELAGLGYLNDTAEDEENYKIITKQIDNIQSIRGTDAGTRIKKYDLNIQECQIALQRSINTVVKYEDMLDGQNINDLNQKKKLLRELENVETKLQTQIRSCKDRIAKAHVELAGVQTSINALDPNGSNEAISRYRLVNDLHNLFNEAIDRLRDKLRTTVEERANDAFLKMTNQPLYRGLKINENYGLSIVDGSGNTVNQPSAGASQLVALALIDGLNRTGRAVGPIIMDTPLARLDYAHRQNVLNYLPTVSSQFVVLVHSGEIGIATDLGNIKSRIGVEYSIEAISENASKLVRNF
jgi:DNA sulfur modification protein DndD